MSERSLSDYGALLQTDELYVRAARRQFFAFMQGLILHPDVLEVVATGSFSRGSALRHVRDLDLIVILPKELLKDRSPAQALALLRHIACLGVLHRPVDDRDRFRGTRISNRAVQFGWQQGALDPAEHFYPSPPPVDLVPAYRAGDQLMVPECSSGAWTPSQPHALAVLTGPDPQWGASADLVRMVKAWSGHHQLGLRSVDALVVRFLPTPQAGKALSMAVALAAFFQEAAAHLAVVRKIEPGLDYRQLRKSLCEAADLADQALGFALRGQEWAAERAWQRILGPEFAPGWLISLARWVWGEQDAASPSPQGFGAGNGVTIRTGPIRTSVLPRRQDVAG